MDPKAAAMIATVSMANYDSSDEQWNCLCDNSCGKYGDCCTDSTHFDPVEHQKAVARYECIPIDGGGGAYAAVKCPATWSNSQIRDACENPDDRDGMLGNPVTSRSTGLAYRNTFCAACNDDAADPIIWDTRLVCDGPTDVTGNGSDKIAVLDTLRYSENGRWTVEYQSKLYDCNPVVVPPVAVHFRSCHPNLVDTCHSMWSHNETRANEIRSNCEAYTTIVYNDDQPYKNIHCAMCNYVPVQNLTCELLVLHNRIPPFESRSFTALFVAQPGHRKCRGSDKFYDPFSKTCRPLRVSVPGDKYGGVPLNCTTIVMYPMVPDDWRPPADAEYVKLENGTTAVCVNTTVGPVPAAEAFKSATLTYVGLGISVVFLIVHLAVFAALPEMKNLSGKNLASFCVSLVCSYASFVAGNWLTGPACYAGAAITYYTFLTSFTWMLVMSFDCWRSLRLATVELRVTTGRQTKKFLVYSAVCWLVPAMATFVAVAADIVPIVPDDVRPKFGEDQCWFGSKTSLLLFFAGPLTVVMVINFVLFLWTAYMIHSSRATVRHINTRHVRRDFRMYCRLAVLMGLTWTTGLLASYTDSKYLWILFVALNTFQGLFVFIAFTCRRRILNSLIGDDKSHNNHHEHTVDPEKDNNGKHLRSPPLSSFSWSSSDNSVPVSSEKTTDTLY